MLLPRLYAIIDRATLDARGISVSDFAAALASAGVSLVQYRDKHGSPQQILSAAAAITAAFAGTNATLILNDRADLAALAGWGVHVGQGDLLPGDTRSVLSSISKNLSSRPERSRVERPASRPATNVIGLSTHTLEQIQQTADSTADYLAIGPIFVTQTKLDASPVTGLDTLRQARALTRKPLVAIGGITLQNCRSVVDAGADSVAVISGLFVSGISVRAVAQDFLERLR